MFLSFPISNKTKVEETYFKFHACFIKKKNSLSQDFFEFVTYIHNVCGCMLKECKNLWGTSKYKMLICVNVSFSKMPPNFLLFFPVISRGYLVGTCLVSQKKKWFFFNSSIFTFFNALNCGHYQNQTHLAQTWF